MGKSSGAPSLREDHAGRQSPSEASPLSAASAATIVSRKSALLDELRRHEAVVIIHDEEADVLCDGIFRVLQDDIVAAAKSVAATILDQQAATIEKHVDPAPKGEMNARAATGMLTTALALRGIAEGIRSGAAFKSGKGAP